MAVIIKFTRGLGVVSTTTTIAVGKCMSLNNSLKLFWVLATLFFLSALPAGAEEVLLTCTVKGFLMNSGMGKLEQSKETISVEVKTVGEDLLISTSGPVFYTMAAFSANDADFKGSNRSDANHYWVQSYSNESGINYDIKINRVTGRIDAFAQQTKGEMPTMSNFYGACKKINRENKF